jgi:hypothetical protein
MDMSRWGSTLENRGHISHSRLQRKVGSRLKETNRLDGLGPLMTRRPYSLRRKHGGTTFLSPVFQRPLTDRGRIPIQNNRETVLEVFPLPFWLNPRTL